MSSMSLRQVVVYGLVIVCLVGNLSCLIYLLREQGVREERLTQALSAVAVSQTDSAAALRERVAQLEARLDAGAAEGGNRGGGIARTRAPEDQPAGTAIEHRQSEQDWLRQRARDRAVQAKYQAFLTHLSRKLFGAILN